MTHTFIKENTTKTLLTLFKKSQTKQFISLLPDQINLDFFYPIFKNNIIKINN